MGFIGRVASGRSRAGLALWAGFGVVSLVFLLLAAAPSLLVTSADGLTVEAGEGFPFVMSGELIPTTLPRTHFAPATMRIGFEVPLTRGSKVPELQTIVLDLASNIELQTNGLPSCPVNRLRSTYVKPVQACKGALVGRGSVTSEIALPGQAPAMVKGSLLAFYDRSNVGPYILADVTTNGSPPLTYVIPFSIGKAKPPFGTSLIVHKMHLVRGECKNNTPDCGYGGFEGIYGHISNFELSLHRIFATPRSRRTSFVGADCPAPGHRASASYKFAKVSVTYAEPSSVGGESAVKPGSCRVAG